MGPDHSRIPLLLSAPNTTDLPTFPLVSTSRSSFPVDCKVSSRGCGAGLNCHPPGLRLQVSFPLAVFSFQFLSSFLIPPTSPWAKENPMSFFPMPFHDFLLSHPTAEGSWTRHSIPPSQFGFRWSTSSLISPFPPRPHSSMELLYCPATVMMIDQDCQRAPIIADCPPRSLYFAWSAALALPSSPVSSHPSPELPSTLSHTFTEAHAPLLPPSN